MSNNSSSGGYSYLFTTTDCMNLPVVLKEGTFTGKIMRDHPEITVEMIQECVECAHIVTSDPKYINRRRYYQILTTPPEGIDHITHIKTVVEYNHASYKGEVVSSYLLSNLKNELTSGSVLYNAGARRKSGI